MKTLNTYYYNKEHLLDYVKEDRFKNLLNSASAVLVKVYCGVEDLNQLEEVLDFLSSLSNKISIVGASTSGGIMNAEVTSNRTIISFNFFQDTTLSVGFMEPDDILEETELVNCIISEHVSENTKGILLLSTRFGYKNDVILKEFSKQCPDLIVFGGVAGLIAGQIDFVVCKHKICRLGIVYVSLQSNTLSISTDYHLNWQPIGKHLTVTEADGHFIKQINNRPATDVLLHYLGDTVANNLAETSSVFPLIFNEDSLEIARVVLQIHDDGSIELPANVEVGDRFRFSFGHMDSILQKGGEVIEKISQKPIETIWMFSCFARLNFFGDAAELELNPLKELGPMAGFFTYGEFFHSGKCNYLLNDTMTLVVLSERDNYLDPSTVYKAHSLVGTKTSNRQIQILQAMTNLISSVTQELYDANNELYNANEELNTVLNQLQHRNGTIEKLHKNITSSIEYASKIQQSMLPSVDKFQKLFPDSFVFYLPRDVVSGDFYWYKQVGGCIYLAVVDCTGHGVPGAFMSILGMNFLDEIASEQTCKTAGHILDQLRIKVKHALKQESKGNDQKNGMDMSLCIINCETFSLQYAGAFNSLYVVPHDGDDQRLVSALERDSYRCVKTDSGALVEIKADKQPIAIYHKEVSFSSKNLQLEKGDALYLFSDGYSDQLGDGLEVKYLSKNFKKLLLSVSNKKMSEQKKEISEQLEAWKGESTQVDDVLVLGVRV